MTSRDAFFFDSKSGNSLFGTTTTPSTKPDASTAIVFCQPFGEERQKAYRSTFLFAEKLADNGIPSFRFDCTGIGDSDGTLLDTDFDRMVVDTESAFDEARQRLQVDRLIPIGIRLGAPVALAALPGNGSSNSCILWNPVVDGSRYYRELMRTEMIIALARKKDTEADESNESIRPPGTVEIDADLMTEISVEKLKAVKLLDSALPVNRLLITTRDSDKPEIKTSTALHEHAISQNIDSSLWSGEKSEYWSARSMHDGFFPVATFEQTLTWLRQELAQE